MVLCGALGRQKFLAVFIQSNDAEPSIRTNKSNQNIFIPMRFISN